MSRNDQASDPQAVLAALQGSSRYRDVDTATLQRVAAEVAPGRRLKDAVQEARERLHQCYGAYLPTRPRYNRLLSDLSQATDAATQRGALRAAMRCHASSRERVDDLERYYTLLFERIPPPVSVLDLGCGLNPLAAPWMGLAPGCRYTAVEIDPALLAFVAGCLDVLGIEHGTLTHDLLSGLPPVRADLALLLKIVPCLERQRAGAGFDLVGALDADTAAVSFPTRSLGGQARGMGGNYRRLFEEQAQARGWRWERIELPGELAFLVRR